MLLQSILFAFAFISLIVIGYLICDIRNQIKCYRYGENYKFKQTYNRILDKMCNSLIVTIRDKELYTGVDDSNEYLFTGEEIINIIEYYRDQHKIKAVED